MKNIIFSYIGGENVGDKHCCPKEFYQFPSSNTVFLKSLFSVLCESVPSNVIIGGGGILDTNTGFNNFYKNLPEKHDYILWGAGTNRVILKNIYWSCSKNELNPEYDHLENFRLVGRRDDNFHYVNYEYVPCVSCKLDALSRKYTIKRKIGVLAHMSQHMIGNFNCAQLSMLLTNTTVEGLLKFVGESEVIVTSSYHGMYWATLMGKKVIIQKPSSTKFQYFKYPPTIYSGNLEKDVEEAKTYPNSLAKSIEINDHFYKKVMNVLS